MIKASDNPLLRLYNGVALPILSLLFAFMIIGLTALACGENPLQAIYWLIHGSLGSISSGGYTLFYTTNFIFTGLSFAIAFHAGLYNLGSEGQVAISGIGLAIMALYFGDMSVWLVLPLVILASVAFSALWGAIPGALQAYRGSSVVLSTLLFNIIAFFMLSYLLKGIWKDQVRDDLDFAPVLEPLQLSALKSLPFLSQLPFIPPTITVASIIALIALALFWFIIWQTRLGYSIRVMGLNTKAAHYAGIDRRAIIILTMALAGLLSSGAALNMLLGVEHKFTLGFVGGAGYVGIAVALMGRHHPIGIFCAALFFGALTQGMIKLTLEMPAIPYETLPFVQGTIIIFIISFHTVSRLVLAKFHQKPKRMRV